MTNKVEISIETVNTIFNYLKRQSWIEVNDIIVTLLRDLPQLPLSTEGLLPSPDLKNTDDPSLPAEAER